ncbi:MAG TPA: hypothetical protein DD670_12470 [Planctomycetaceae bacterium]|nr:hypothetical protein [Planctomycetaceae bacterium]
MDCREVYAWSGSSPNGDTITLAPGSSTNIGQLRVGVGTTVVAGNTNALKTNMTLVMQGGTFKLNGLNLATSGLYGTSGNIQNGSDMTAATLTVQRNAGDVTYGGTFTDGGSAAFGLTKTGSSMLTLTGTNTYSGTTTVSAGTLRIGNGTTDGSIVGNIVDNATLVFNNASARTYAGVISGSGSVTKSGSGVLTITGANTYAGGTTISGGTMVLDAANGYLHP